MPLGLDGVNGKGIIAAIVAVIGGFAYGFVGGLLPTFSFSGIVYAVVGLVVVALGFHLLGGSDGRHYAGSFAIGFGLVMASGLVTSIKGLLPASTSG